MKKSGLLFAFAMFFMSFATVSAQKIATLDVAEILNLMPEKKKADQQLEAFSKTKQAEIEKQMTAAEAKFKKYQEEAAKQTPKVNQEREQELQKLQQNILLKISKISGILIGWKMVFSPQLPMRELLTP